MNFFAKQLRSSGKTIGIFVIGILLVTSARPQSGSPNIIYIMADDLAYGDLSCYGRKDYATPNLDKLASQGIKFTQAYAASSLCTPTRTALMTGRYPARTPVGLMEPLLPVKRDSAYGLTADYPSLATLVKAKGYETVLIGKWHLGYLPQHSPIRNGFDYFFGIRTGAADYISHKGDGGRNDLYENDTPVHVDGYLTELFTQKAIAFLKQPHSKPFLLVLTYNAPHFPWQGPGAKPYPDSVAFSKGGSPDIYAAMVKSLDDGVGAVIKALDALGLGTKTLVIFTSDNGGDRYADEGGLAKGKFYVWEGGIRVPAFMRWTCKIPAGITSQQPVITMDWTATMLAAAGAQAHPDFPLDGINIVPISTGQKLPVERTFYWRTTQFSRQNALRYGRWKYLHVPEGERLFDLWTDPGEQKDVKATESAVFQRMRKMFADWEQTVLTPIL